MEKIIVAKFGGSSLADSGQFVKVKNIIEADSQRKFVVPSAPGKRSPEDVKITDLLYTCYVLANKPEKFNRLFSQIKQRYEEIISDLGLKLSLEKEFEEIKKAFIDQKGEAYAASRGEYLNGIILANYLGFTFVDAADVIRFNSDGNLDDEITNKLIGEKLSALTCAVIPGFYGADFNGVIHTFSRGGSDVTGSLVARGIRASLYENWTDVNGFLIADPRLISHPKKIDIMTFAELRELSYRGASVLHEDAVYPARREGIPIHIRNTNHPEESGTIICHDVDPSQENTITGIAGKQSFVSISISKNGINSQTYYYKQLLDAIEENQITTEHMPSGIDSISVILPDSEFCYKRDSILNSINTLIKPDTINVDEDLAIITVVGKGMRSSSGIAARFFSALGKAQVNIKMIDMGSNEMNCSIGVSNKDFKKAIQALYEGLVI